MEILILLAIGLVGYGVIAFFFPEWVGITGKTAKKNLKSHNSGEVEDTKNEAFSKLDK